MIEHSISFEQIEGRFHDGLGTFNELCVANEIIARFGLGQPAFDLDAVIAKMEGACLLLGNDFRRDILERERIRVERAATDVVTLINQFLAGHSPTYVSHTPHLYLQGKAADIVVTTEIRGDFHFSLKIDKSGKAALSEIGQIRDVYKLFHILFRLSASEVDELAHELFGVHRIEEIFDRSDNVALILQVALIRVMGLRTGDRETQPNNLGNARPTNLEGVQHLFRMIKQYKGGNDDAIVIVVDRRTGLVSTEFLIDEIDPDQIRLGDIGFTPCKPKPGKYRWGTEPCIKYMGRAVFSMQVKHRRGVNSGSAFRDITTRIRR